MTEIIQAHAFRRYLLILAATFFSISVPLVVTVFYLASLFGASSTPDQLAELQLKRPETIVLPFDLRHNAAFKLRRVEQEQPDVICFSSSRAGGFQASMFEPYRFYNMSFTVWTTEQLADVFERTTRVARPRLAILSLDYFMFTDQWEKSYSGTRDMIFDHPMRYTRSSVGNFIRATAQHTDILTSYLRSPSPFVGTQAIVSQEGFRADGSYVYSPGHLQDARLHYQTAEFLVNAVPGAPQMSARQKAPIARLAEIAQQRGIRLMAVQLPLIRAGVDYLDNNQSYSHWSGVWREFQTDDTRAWLRGLGISFFDLARSPIDYDRKNFVDAYHPSQIGMLKVMRQLLADPDFRADFSQLSTQMIDKQIAEIARSL